MSLFRAVLSNAQHPEYGVATIPFPIPEGEYEHCIELLDALEIGDPLRRDCKLDEINGNVTALKRLEGCQINIEEMNYLAQRLDSFIDSELTAFQAMILRNGYEKMPDLINLTFCCQEATMITDFSDLEQIGKDHVLTVNGGMEKAEFEQMDFRFEALKLILNNRGWVTPYGVVYDNGMQLADLYDGRFFPEYHYRADVLTLAASSRRQPEDIQEIVYLYLPATETQIERALARGGIDGMADARLRFLESVLPENVDAFLDMENVSITELNALALAYAGLDNGQRQAVGGMMELAQPQNVTELCNLLHNVELFYFVPNVKTAEDYGKYMIRESGRFDYDPYLDDCYDYLKYGMHRLAQEHGMFTAGGYICYQGEAPLNDIMRDQQEASPETGMAGMEMG